MVEKKEGEAKSEPIRFDNVVVRSGSLVMRGVNIVVGILDSFYLYSIDRIDECVLEAEVDSIALGKILAGEEVQVEGEFIEIELSPYGAHHLGG